MSLGLPRPDSATLRSDGGPASGGVSDAEWMRRFTARVAEQRVPVSGLLELTSRCNLRCVHCYLGPQEHHWARRHQEPGLERLLAIIDEIVDAGCLYLGITGGDPMIHEHFTAVYRHAREKGLIVTVLCNGILVRDEILELFREYPPASVEVSLYGATQKTYEAVTCVPGSYARCRAGIRRLIDAGVRVELKTVMMTLNAHEIDAMRRIADELGVAFRMDAGLFPELQDRDAQPLKLRVSPQESVEREFADPRTARTWSERLERDVVPSQELYRCGAGVTGFYIDPYGQASPCLMTTQHRHSLAERSFKSLWERELVQIKSTRPGDHYGCNDCEMQVACTGCPGFNHLENGREDVKSEYVCETTHERWKRIQLEIGSRRAAGPSIDGWQPVALGRRPPTGAPMEATPHE